MSLNDVTHWVSDSKGKILEIPSIDKLCEILKTKFEKQEYIIKNLQDKIKKLENKNWKDEELQSMKEELIRVKKEANLGFPISESEHKAAMDWIEKHEEEKHPRPEWAMPRGGAIGGSYTWKFIPTSIGVFGSVHCSCGDSFTFQEEG